jgi:hypothetical protein
MRSAVIAIFVFIYGSVFTQGIVDTANNIPLISIHFSGQKPLGDLADRFGENFSVGGNFLYKFKKNWILGAEGNYFFGNNVKDDVLANLRNADGFVIDNEGYPADLRLNERGWTAHIIVGKIFPVLSPNPNSGPLINLGFGYMQHKIHFYDANKKVAAINGDMKKGYDRLTGGFSMHQFLGYAYLSNNRLINIIAGFEFYEGFTKSYREFNYDTGLPDTKTRMDLLVGFRIGWILPLYQRSQGFYYN